MADKHAPKGATSRSGVPAIRVARAGRAPVKVKQVALGRKRANFGPDRSFVMLLMHEQEPTRIQDAIRGGRVLGSGLRAIRTELQLTVEEMARLLDVATRSVNRKEKSKQPLSVSEGDRAFRLARIADLAVQLIGDREKASSWLRTPNTYLGGKTPVEMLDTEVGTDFVSQSLYSIAYGGVA